MMAADLKDRSRNRHLSRLIVLTLLVAACGGSGAESGTTTSTTGTTAGGSTTVAVATNVPATESVDLPHICSVIDASEMASILGNEVTIDDSFAADCYYETGPDALGEMDSQTSVFAAPAEDCSFFLPTDPVFPGEEIEPAPEYGDLATLTTTEFSAEYAVCANGLALGVTVRGAGSVTPELRLAAAGAILDLLLERL